MANPTLSIIVPGYKTAGTIVRALDSIFSQLTDGLADEVEVIAVEDFSPDNVGAIMDDYQKAHPALKVIHRATNGGEAGAHNTGMEAATGDYFLRLDSDDALKAGSVARILELVRLHEPDILLHAFTRVTPEGTFLSQSSFAYEGLIDLKSAPKALVKRAFGLVAFGIMTANAVYRRSAASFVRQDPRYPISGDRLFGWHVFRQSSRFYLTNESFYDYYIYPTSMSRTLSDRAVAGLLELNIRFWNECREHPLFAVGRCAAFRRLFFGQVGWDYEIVFEAEPEKRQHADLYFAALANFLKGGAALRVIGVWAFYLKLTCLLKSPRLAGLYRAAFPKFVWRAERKLKRCLKSLVERLVK